MQKWSDCPVDGCAAGQACKYGTANSVTSNPQFPALTDSDDYTYSQDLLQTWKDWTWKLSGHRCSCQANSPITHQWSAPGRFWPYCDSNTPSSAAECRALVLERNSESGALPVADTVQKTAIDPGTDPFGCSSTRTTLQVRGPDDCHLRSFPKHFARELIAKTTTDTASDCKETCAKTAGCVYWTWAAAQTVTFVVERPVYSSTFLEKHTDSMPEHECRLLSFVLDHIVTSTEDQIYSGPAVCLVQTRASCTKLPHTLSNSVSNVTDCPTSCDSLPNCDAAEWSESTKCTLFECTGAASSEFLLFPGITLFRRGVTVVYRTEPVSAQLKNMGLTFEATRREAPWTVCRGAPAPFFPTNAGDLQVSFSRSRESCPTGYAEISSKASCTEATRYVSGGWTFMSVQNRNCPVNGILELRRTVYDMTHHAQCELACFENWQCTTFMWVPPSNTSASVLVTLSGTRLAQLPAGAEADRAWSSASSKVLDADCLPLSEWHIREYSTTRAVDVKRAEQLCGYRCFQDVRCLGFRLHIKMPNVCQMYDACLKLTARPTYSAVNLIRRAAGAYLSASMCKLYSTCDLWDGITQPDKSLVAQITSANLVSWSLLRTPSPVEVVPLSEQSVSPPGCFVYSAHIGQPTRFRFNEYRDMVTWAQPGNPSPHELPSESTTVDAVYSDTGVCTSNVKTALINTPLSECRVAEAGTGIHRRICAKTHMANYNQTEDKELGASWGTLVYGTGDSGTKQRNNTWQYDNHTGVHYALASVHGVSCQFLPGYTHIVSRRQCASAAQAFGDGSSAQLHQRLEPLSKQFMGETWYLVRRVPGASGIWHPATDDLVGTDIYGTYETNETSDSAFSMQFGNTYNKVMFASGDMSAWIVLPRESGCLSKNYNKIVSTAECGLSGSENLLLYDTALLKKCRNRWYPSTANSSYTGNARVPMSCAVQFSENDGLAVNIYDPRVLLSTTVLDRPSTALQGDTLYAEASMPATGRFAHLALPVSGANVWVNGRPGDGFVLSRSEQVPGCSLDTPIAGAGVAELRKYGAAWYSPSSDSSMQYGDDAVNFNPKQISGSFSNDSFSSTQTELFQRGDGWLRGRSICVLSTQLLPEWTPLWVTDAVGSLVGLPDYLLGSQQGAACPASYTHVQQEVQCQTVYSLMQTMVLYANGDTATDPTAASSTYTSSQQFVRLEHVAGSVHEFVTGCLLLPYNLGDQEEMPWNATGYGWSDLNQRLSFNPAIVSEFEGIAFGTTNDDTERPLYGTARGYSVCVKNTSNIASGSASDKWYTMQMQIAYQRKLFPVVERPGQSRMQVIGARMKFDGMSPTSTTELQEFESLLLSTIKKLTAIDIEIQQRMDPDSSEYTALLNVSVTRERTTWLLETLRNITMGESKLLITMRQDAVTTRRVAPGALQLVTGIVFLLDSVTDAPGGFVMRADYDVSPLSITPELDRRLWWQASCECLAAEGSCGSTDMRVALFRAEAIAPSHRWWTTPVFRSENTSEYCSDACNSDPSCSVALFHEGPDVLVLPVGRDSKISDLSRCMFFDQYEALSELVTAPMGPVAVFVKPNGCPTIKIAKTLICQTDSVELCVHLLPVYIQRSDDIGSFGYNVDTGGQVVSLHPDDGRRESSCWAHVNQALRLHLLCRDGGYVPILASDPSKTPECDGIGGRYKCPPSRPFMCAYRHSYATDYHCAANSGDCSGLGGVRSCSWFDYDTVGVPALKRVPYDPVSPATTSTLSRSFDSELAINSVSRCGQGWSRLGHEYVIMEPGVCPTGFACCDSGTPYPSAARQLHINGSCSCPALAGSDHIALHGGAFAGACHPVLSTWPICQQECVAMGPLCQYFVRPSDTQQNECLLCYQADGFVESKDWTYHVVRTPATPTRETQEYAAALASGALFVHDALGDALGDATKRIEGRWYAAAETCPHSYDPVIPQDAAGDAKAFLHCTRAARALNNSGSHFIPDVMRTSVNGPQRCRCAYAVGCSFVHVPQETRYAVPQGIIYQDFDCIAQCRPTQLVPKSTMPLGVCVQQAGASDFYQSNWRICSVACSRNLNCTHWSWNSESMRCALMSASSRTDTSRDRIQWRQMPSLSVVGTPVRVAPFGNNWFGGPRVDNPLEIYEQQVLVTRVRVYSEKLSLAQIERAHYEMMNTFPGIKATPNNETLSFFGIPSLSPVLTNAYYDPLFVWQLTRFPGTDRSPRVALFTDTDCWHSSQTGVPDTYTGDYVPSAPTDTVAPWRQKVIDYQLAVVFWFRLRRHTANRSECAVLTGHLNTTQSLGYPTVWLCRKILLGELFYELHTGFRGNGSTLAVRRFSTPFVVGRWYHVALQTTQNTGRVTLFVSSIAQEQYTLDFNTFLPSAHDLTRASGTRLGDSFVDEAPVLADAVMLDLSLIQGADNFSPAKMWSQRDADCVHSMLRTGPSRFELMNPVADVYAETIVDDRGGFFIPDAVEHRQARFEWQVGNCESQELDEGGEYSFEAVYETNLYAPAAFHADLVGGIFEPRWLSTSTIANSTHTQLELVTRPSDSADVPVWKAYRTIEGSANVSVWSLTVPGSAVVMRTELQLEADTTYADVYQIHGEQANGTRSPGSLVMESQIDVDVVLATDTSVHLLAPRCISCYGNCTFLSGTLFALVRRISDIDVGAITDMHYDPLGRIRVVPVGFVNGSETHSIDHKQCLSNRDTYYTDGGGNVTSGGGNVTSGGANFTSGGVVIVSQYTGRCLFASQGGSSYGECASLSPDVKCWIISRSRQSHDDSDYSGQRTLAFDDSGRHPSNAVISPLRSVPALFLKSNSSTEITFDIAVFATTEDDAADSMVTPIRMYSADSGTVMSVPVCFATYEGSTVACDTVCSTTTTGTSVCVPVGMSAVTHAVCSERCFPRLVHPTDTLTVGTIDIDLLQSATGYLLRQKQHVSVPGPDLCLVSHTDPADVDALQLVPCALGYVDYFETISFKSPGVPDSQTPESLDHKYVRSTRYGKCVGQRRDGAQLSVRVGMVSCNKTNELLHLVHAFRDDGDLMSGPTAALVAAERKLPEALFKYSDGVRSIAVYFHRKESAGTVRIVVDFGGDCGPTVSLLDATGGIARTPSKHRYVVSVARGPASDTEHRTATVFRNGTVVDRLRWSARCKTDRPATSPVHRTRDFDPKQTYLVGTYSSVDLRSTVYTGASAGDNALSVFGSSRKWRMYRRDRMHRTGNADRCATLCKQSGKACAAARWSELSRWCELLSHCDRSNPVCEGQPNTFNLVPSPCYLFVNGGTHNVQTLEGPRQVAGMTSRARTDESGLDGMLAHTIISAPGAPNTVVRMQATSVMEFIPQASTLFANAVPDTGTPSV